MQLTHDQHRQAAALTTQVHTALEALSNLAFAAGDDRYHREVRITQRRIQARLINPLIDAWDAALPIADNPYEEIEEWDVLISKLAPGAA